MVLLSLSLVFDISHLLSKITCVYIFWQICDWPHNAGCANGGSGEDSGNSNEGSASGEGDNTEEADNGNGGEGDNTEEVDNGNSGEDNNVSSASNEVEVELLPNGCPADFNIHQLLPHESDCTKFYYCVHGEKQERECRDGLFFNPAIQVNALYITLH